MTGAGGLATTILEEILFQSTMTSAMVTTTSFAITTTPTTSPTTSTTHPPLPRYNGRQVDNSDLLEAIDWVDHKLSEAATHERLGTGLTITATLQGRITHITTVSQSKRYPPFPSSLRNSAALASCHARWCSRVLSQ